MKISSNIGWIVSVLVVLSLFASSGCYEHRQRNFSRRYLPGKKSSHKSSQFNLTPKALTDYKYSNTNSSGLRQNKYSNETKTQRYRNETDQKSKLYNETTGGILMPNDPPFTAGRSVTKLKEVSPVITSTAADQENNFKGKQNGKENVVKHLNKKGIVLGKSKSPVLKSKKMDRKKQTIPNAVTERMKTKKQNVGSLPNFVNVAESSASMLPLLREQVNPKVETLENAAVNNEGQTANNFGAGSEIRAVNPGSKEEYPTSLAKNTFGYESFANVQDPRMAATELEQRQDAEPSSLYGAVANSNEAANLKNSIDTKQRVNPNFVSDARHFYMRPVHRYFPLQHKYVGGVIHRFINPKINGNLAALLKNTAAGGSGTTGLNVGGGFTIPPDGIFQSQIAAGALPGTGPMIPEVDSGPVVAGPEAFAASLEPGPRPNRLVFINRPVHHVHQMKVPMPVAIPGPPPPPKLVVISRPVAMPPRRVPVPVVIQPPPRLLVVHHRPSPSVSNPCVVNPCVNGGSCSVVNNEFKCTCAQGYKGFRCNEQTRCFPNPCKNFGTCTELEDEFECTCHVGFHGKICEIESKCEPSPCKNGATCTEIGETYTCSCMPGFMGHNCERESKCHPINPCQNNGICTEDLAGYRCNCRDGYLGLNCEGRYMGGACDSNPCANEGTCVVDFDDPTKFSCFCATGFNGPSCQDIECFNCPSLAQCVKGVCMLDSGLPYHGFSQASPIGQTCQAVNPCLYGGTCQPAGPGDSYTCLCPPGRVGLHCEEPDHVCDACHHMALCILGKCTCRPGYRGDGIKCEKERPHYCHPNPCENGGTCHEDGDTWYCECPKGYEGKFCKHIDPCKTFICHNGGQCTVVDGQPHCTCVPPYTGATCEDDNGCLPLKGKIRNPCQNGGTCNYINQETKCVCPPEYEGPTCGTNKCDKCSVNAFCDKGVCKCKPPFVGNGVTCELEASPTRGPASRPTEKDTCDPNPCKKGGTCVSTRDNFICVCPVGAGGRTCELETSPPTTAPPTKSVCHPNPCLNNGVCKENGNKGFDCVCSNPRYKGIYCDLDVCADCDINARCILGKCRCNKGYEGDGFTCTKINDCDNCPPMSQCISGDICICSPGYTMSPSYSSNTLHRREMEHAPVKRTCIPFPSKPTVARNNRPQQWSEDIIIAEYKSLGCWADTSNWRDPSNRAMVLLESKDKRLKDDYHFRKQPISKCAEVARKKGFKIFAIQNSGQCFGAYGDLNFRKFGPSEGCANGVGGKLANDVYEL